MKKSTLILIWGAITGVASTLFYQILFATGQEDSGLRWFNLLILFLGLFIGTMYVRNKTNEGYFTFGQGFKTGFLMVLLITLIAVIGTIVRIQMHPDFIDKILEQAKTNMINNGNSDEQIEMGMKITREWTTPTMIVLFTVLGSLFGGAIFSLITAGLCTRKRPIFDDAEEVPNTESNN